MTQGINRQVEFFSRGTRRKIQYKSKPIFRTYKVTSTIEATVREILQDYRFQTPFENLNQDTSFIAHEIDLYLWPIIGNSKTEAIDMVKAPFFRNKVAYLVGRIHAKNQIIPLVLPLYNGNKGIYVDAVLFRNRQLSIIFGFAHTCFHVEIEHHDELIEFLKTILPNKRIDELYFMIGLTKHGKTEFYRDLHRYIHVSKEKFVIAKGLEGSIMTGFTLPHFNFVFKVIKDYPCYLRSSNITTKRVSREHVIHCYQCVCNRDRVGRMVDTQEFENMKFKRKRFSSKLLHEFKIAAKDTVTINDDYVIIKHLYLQRKVIPLPLYLEIERDPEVIREVIIDYGYFLQEIAAVGVFPADLFNIWNCGVTSRRRIVLFDYDDIESLLDINFREKPLPHNQIDELIPDEDRIVAYSNDFFMDEMKTFMGIPKSLQGVFNQIHGDLFKVDFWHKMQQRVRRGDILDIIPYDRERQFTSRFRDKYQKN